MIVDSIPVNTPLLGEREREYLGRCIETGWISSEGPFVKEFEEKFSACVGRRHGIAVSSGTAALDCAMAALDLGFGDEVILPSLTIISCASAIVRTGATPVTVDSLPDVWNMNPDEVAAKITPRTKAILVVHLYGLPVDVDPILSLAEKHGLAVVEDAAEAIGQTHRGRQCGSFGDISVFSFYPNKHITTGEGGMVVTNSEDLALKCNSLRNLCFGSGRKRFVHENLGWNYRMTNMQAALGLAQLESLDNHLEKKRRMGAIYGEALAKTSGLILPIAETPYARNLFWVFGVILEDDRFSDSFEVTESLANRAVATRPFFWPIHEQPVFHRMGLFEDVSHPVAEKLARRGFYLPSGLGLSETQILRAAEELKQIMA